MEDIQQKVFSDFEVPNTSDGSFVGRKKVAIAQEKHLQMKFEEEIVQINQRLKASKTKVTIYSRKGTIQLRATLPLKPGDTHPKGKDKKQYTISLGIPASFDGLKTAEEEAQELGKLIARQTFTWIDKYLGVQTQKKDNLTFREFYEQFEKIYFSTRKRTIKSEHTFYNLEKLYRNNFLSNQIISSQSINLVLNSTNSVSTRLIYVSIARIISHHLNIDLNLDGIDLDYTPGRRDIPSDELIVKLIQNIDDYVESVVYNKDKAKNAAIRNKLFYGLMATYGLRPREILNKPDFDWFLSIENKHNTFKVHESNKTGYREVFPFVPEWIEIFDLHNPINIEFLKNYCHENKNLKLLNDRAGKIAGFFKLYEIPFKPYDLRHACAIRAHLQGIPIKAAADNLGHSVEIHTKTYQRWFGLENRRKAFNQAFNEKKENERLILELTKAKERIAELEAELSRYKLKEMI